MIRIISFGYGHGEPPQAEITIDLRFLLRNPHRDPAMRDLTGLDPAVYEHVLATPGALRLAEQAAATARSLAEDTGRPVTLACGCVGGRHRAVGIARRTYDLLQAAGADVTLDHRDVGREVLPPSAHA